MNEIERLHESARIVSDYEREYKKLSADHSVRIRALLGRMRERKAAAVKKSIKK